MSEGDSASNQGMHNEQQAEDVECETQSVRVIKGKAEDNEPTNELCADSFTAAVAPGIQRCR